MLAKKGLEAAEAAMISWNNRDRVSDYAAGIEPVARGIYALSQASSEDKLVRFVEVRDRMLFPISYAINPSQMVVFFNRQAPKCGCQQLKNSDIFSPHGDLGLKAVTLQMGYSREYNKLTAQLGLVLPNRAHANESGNGFVVAAIKLSGWTTSFVRALSFDSDEVLVYSLGLAGLEQAVTTMSSSGGEFDHVIGFPGATNFLADSLPGLGKYFVALAERLSPIHKH